MLEAAAYVHARSYPLVGYPRLVSKEIMLILARSSLGTRACVVGDGTSCDISVGYCGRQIVRACLFTSTLRFAPARLSTAVARMSSLAADRAGVRAMPLPRVLSPALLLMAASAAASAGAGAAAVEPEVLRNTGSYDALVFRHSQ